MRALIIVATVTLLTAAPLLAKDGMPVTTADAFGVQVELQGLYDEITQTTLQFIAASDADNFHRVVCTPDWVFIDAKGHQQAWSQMRPQAIHALSATAPASMIQRIQKLTADAGGAKVELALTTVRTRTAVDNEGRYGRPGASHTLRETTVFRDQWVKVSGVWKWKSREQIGGPIVSADKSYPNME